jgi:RHS repeat-associated protein
MSSNGIDQIEADEQLTTGTTLWALTDHLGSVRDVVDNSGVNQNHIVYDAFGNITSQSNSSVIFRNSYTGQEFDPESGLFSYGGRYYDPFNGKFIQEDKIGFAGGDANLNRYVRNNSINYTDPTGYDELAAVRKAVLDPILGAIGLGLGQIIGEGIKGLGEIGRGVERALVPPAGDPNADRNSRVNQQKSESQVSVLNPFISRPAEPPSPFPHPPNKGTFIPPTTETFPLPQLPDPRPLISPAADSYIQGILDNIIRNCNDNLKIPPFLSISDKVEEIIGIIRNNNREHPSLD